MARRGRTRKTAPRHPSGQLVRPRTDPVATARDQRLARGATLENWRDQAHESPLGRIYRKGGLGDLKDAATAEQAKRRYEAGVWYRGVWDTKDRMMGLPRRTIRAQGHVGGMAKEIDPAAYWAALQRETAATNAIPKGCKAAVYQIIILEAETIYPFWVDELPRALDALAKHREG